MLVGARVTGTARAEIIKDTGDLLTISIPDGLLPVHLIVDPPGDDLDDLMRAPEALAYCPDDVWLWMMASQWQLIGNTEPLVGRTAKAADRRRPRAPDCPPRRRSVPC